MMGWRDEFSNCIPLWRVFVDLVLWLKVREKISEDVPQRPFPPEPIGSVGYMTACMKITRHPRQFFPPHMEQEVALEETPLQMLQIST